MAVFTPVYASVTDVPECYRVGNGDLLNFSWTSAFWIHNRVANMAYHKYSFMIQDIRKVQQELENGYQETVPAIDKAAQELYAKDPAEAVKFLTWYSTTEFRLRYRPLEAIGRVFAGKIHRWKREERGERTVQA